LYIGEYYIGVILINIFQGVTDLILVNTDRVGFEYVLILNISCQMKRYDYILWNFTSKLSRSCSEAVRIAA
jgi:hypothetical protein